ncbi:hypothetical protein WJX77_004976 [Trebouxia sp. C0004]
MQLITHGAWSTPLYPLKKRLSADEVPERFPKELLGKINARAPIEKLARHHLLHQLGYTSVCAQPLLITDGDGFASMDDPARKLAAGSGYQGPERQEDAHDFIRQWLDAAQQHLKGCVKQAHRKPLEYIFSWVTEDQIECQGCHYNSLRYEEDMDLCLPIFNGFDQQGRPQVVPSVQEALSLFTARTGLTSSAALAAAANR